jgi:hypothetical protein
LTITKAYGEAFAAASSNGIIPPDGKRFVEWNTARDGKGNSYAPGEAVTMPAQRLTLYAIWEDISNDAAEIPYYPSEVITTPADGQTRYAVSDGVKQTCFIKFINWKSRLCEGCVRFLNDYFTRIVNGVIIATQD